MQWQEFIDGYDWKARLIPTAILLLPLFCTLYSFFPRLLGSALPLAGSSVLAFALIYLASMVFRDRGVRYARQFWEERGGMPSTRFGRMGDSFLSPGQKSRIQVMVLKRFGIRLLSWDEEREYPALADRKIMEAFREIKEFLRRCEGCSLVEKHGAEYGFARNLCGSRMTFVAQAVGGIVVCGCRDNWPHWTFTAGSLANLILLIVWIPFAWLILPRMMMLTADTYAGRAWVTFLSLTEGTARKPSASATPGSDLRRASN